MRISEGLVSVSHQGWRIWAVPDWLPRIGTVIEESGRDAGWLHASKHARTRALRLPASSRAYLKVYRRYGRCAMLKDAVRPSKALRSLVVGAALSRAGFPAARVLVAGERRSLRILVSAFVVTEEVRAPSLHELLGSFAGRGERKRKRRLLDVLGCHIGRLHEAGFYHGDLVPTNVRVGGGPERPVILLMDNDRTRRGRRALGLLRARRNLVQLNRFVVAGVTATDRWRVLRAYCRARCLDVDSKRRLGRWVMAKTAERRCLFDGVADARRMSFRRLMMTPGTREGPRKERGRDAAPAQRV